MNTLRVRFRRFQKGDEAQVQRIVNDSTFVTLNPCFIDTVTKELTAQILLTLAAVLFIILNAPLFLAIASAPLSFALIYLGIYVGHWVKIIQTHTDLKAIEGVYSGRRAFFVAEAIGESSSSEGPLRIMDSNFIFPKDTPREIVGTIALDIKHDPDKTDPPDSVALIRRLAVKPGYRERGLGLRLLESALGHAKAQDFRAAEVLTTQYHDSARSLYTKRGFKSKKSFKKPLLFGTFSIEMHRMRMDLNEKSRFNL